eukprot:c16278_g1_i5.p1 GENE.c16278_g1_i5~~c16278_g1_i5.p1  ORF type:complete len:675 (+),score=132.52 c16278_g1_i5:118-2025(+)
MFESNDGIGIIPAPSIGVSGPHLSDFAVRHGSDADRIFDDEFRSIEYCCPSLVNDRAFTFNHHLDGLPALDSPAQSSATQPPGTDSNHAQLAEKFSSTLWERVSSELKLPGQQLEEEELSPFLATVPQPAGFTPMTPMFVLDWQTVRAGVIEMRRNIHQTALLIKSFPSLAVPAASPTERASGTASLLPHLQGGIKITPHLSMFAHAVEAAASTLRPHLPKTQTTPEGGAPRIKLSFKKTTTGEEQWVSVAQPPPPSPSPQPINGHPIQRPTAPTARRRKRRKVDGAVPGMFDGCEDGDDVVLEDGYQSFSNRSRAPQTSRSGRVIGLVPKPLREYATVVTDYRTGVQKASGGGLKFGAAAGGTVQRKVAVKSALHQIKKHKQRLMASADQQRKAPSLASSRVLTGERPHRSRNGAPSMYDIDNMVIPVSMATTAPVVKKGVKEILVPSWRYVKRSTAGLINNNTTTSNGDDPTTHSSNPEQQPEQLQPIGRTESSDEDTSEESFRIRHAKHEERERKAVRDALAALNSRRRSHGTPHSQKSQSQNQAQTPTSTQARTPTQQTTQQQRAQSSQQQKRQEETPDEAIGEAEPEEGEGGHDEDGDAEMPLAEHVVPFLDLAAMADAHPGEASQGQPE